MPAHTARPNLTEAYQDGLRAGKADRLLGIKSEYAWGGVELDQPYTYAWHYSRGYRESERESK